MKRKGLNIREVIPYVKESQILTDYEERFNDYIIRIKIFKVPILRKRNIGLKYSLVLIKNGIKIVGFDNHENKVPHVHIYDKEFSYIFINQYKLINDFYLEIRSHIK